MTIELAPEMMTTEEAHAAADEIRKATQTFTRDLGRLRALALDFHERKGWVALGYNTIEACAKNEFGWKRSQFYAQLTAGKIEERAGLAVGSTPEHAFRNRPSSPQQKVRTADNSLPNSCGIGDNASEEDGQRSAASVKRAVEKAEGKASENASEGVEKSGRANDRQDAEDQSPGETQSEPLPDFLGDTQAVTQSEPETQSGPLDYTANAIRDLGEIEAAVLKRNNISVGKAAGLFSQIVAAAEQGGATWEARLRAACRPGLK